MSGGLDPGLGLHPAMGATPLAEEPVSGESVSGMHLSRFVGRNEKPSSQCPSPDVRELGQKMEFKT